MDLHRSTDDRCWGAVLEFAGDALYSIEQTRRRNAASDDERDALGSTYYWSDNIPFLLVIAARLEYSWRGNAWTWCRDRNWLLL